MVTSRKIILVKQPGAANPRSLYSAHPRKGSVAAAREARLPAEPSYQKKDRLTRDWPYLHSGARFTVDRKMARAKTQGFGVWGESAVWQYLS